jgi:uncharacterized protein YbjQ (UPF0145 family)
MLFTTTDTLQGWTIQAYLGTVATHSVLGTGPLTELSSSISDLLGTTSGAYGQKLDELERGVTRALTHKAVLLNANAVIGLRVDYDEISAGGKSLLMVAARGTAVRATPGASTKDRGSLRITVEEFEAWKNRLDLTQKAESGTLNVDDQRLWEFVTANQAGELAPWLLRGVASYLKTYNDLRPVFLERLDAYFLALPPAQAQAALYRAMTGDPNLTCGFRPT